MDKKLEAMQPVHWIVLAIVAIFVIGSFFIEPKYEDYGAKNRPASKAETDRLVISILGK